MHLAYSAVNQTASQQTDPSWASNEILLRYQAYQNTCSKYSNEIAAIQKYMPGWMPAFR